MKHELQTRNNNYDLFDVFDDFFKPMFYENTRELKTDIRETDTTYELELALPGFKKQEIKVSLESGYLTVTAEKSAEEHDSKRYLRRELSESATRSYYVGTDMTREDIKAKFENGILTLSLPKEQPKKQEVNTLIEID